MISTARNIAAPCGTVGFTWRGKRCLHVTNRRNFELPALARAAAIVSDETGAALTFHLTREPTVHEIVAAGKPGEHEQIVFCGPGEPTLRLYDVLQAATELRQHGSTITLSTDGLANRFYQRDVTPDLEGIVDALTVGLVAQDAETYDRLFHPPYPGSFASVIDFVDRVREFVPQITLTASEEFAGVDLVACRTIARNLGVSFESRALDAIC